MGVGGGFMLTRVGVVVGVGVLLGTVDGIGSAGVTE